MPADTLADTKRLLREAHALLNALGDQWRDDLNLLAQSKIAGEHVQAALDALRQAEESLRAREEAASE